MSTQIDDFDLGEIRLLLNQFDAVDFDAFCLDYFPEVYNEFTSNMQRTARMTLLFEYCRKSPQNWILFLNIAQKKGLNINDALKIDEKIKIKHEKTITLDLIKLTQTLDKLSEWKTAHNDTQNLLGDIKTLIGFLSVYQKTPQLDLIIEAGSYWQETITPKFKYISKNWKFQYAKSEKIDTLYSAIITIDGITRRMRSRMDKEDFEELYRDIIDLRIILWQLLSDSDQEIIKTVDALRAITQG